MIHHGGENTAAACPEHHSQLHPALTHFWVFDAAFLDAFEENSITAGYEP